MKQKWEVVPYDPQGRAHATRIYESREKAERVAREMREERRGTGWRYEVGPFPPLREYRNAVLGLLDSHLSKAQDVLGSKILDPDVRERDAALYRFGNSVFNDIERIRRVISKGKLP